MSRMLETFSNRNEIVHLRDQINEVDFTSTLGFEGGWCLQKVPYDTGFTINCFRKYYATI